MKVLLVSKAFVSLMYRRKLDELVGLGVEVVAVTPSEWKDGASAQKLEIDSKAYSYDLRVLPVRFNGHFHYHRYAGLSRLMDEVRPDIVHMDEEPYNVATFLGVLAARRRAIPSLFFTWQNLVRRYPPPFADIERAVYRWSSLGIAGSAEAADVLRRKGYLGGVAVAPQFGVDPDLFFPGSAPSAPFTVGYFNRLVPAKAPLQSLQAFARLPADTRMIVVGDGPMKPDVLETVDRLGLGNRVSVMSRVPSTEMPTLMRSVQAVVLPSVSTPGWKEQFGRVLIEAMACGVPAIGSDSGEIPQVVGDAGLIVHEGDVDALAGAMRRIHDDDQCRAELGRRGRRRVLEHFTHRRVAEATLRAYVRVLKGGVLPEADIEGHAPLQATTCSSSISSSSASSVT